VEILAADWIKVGLTSAIVLLAIAFVLNKIPEKGFEFEITFPKLKKKDTENYSDIFRINNEGSEVVTKLMALHEMERKVVLTHALRIGLHKMLEMSEDEDLQDLEDPFKDFFDSM
jgi:hypothetical protein